MKLRDARPAIAEALKRMRELPESTRPFVIVETVSPRRFVQFRGSDAEAIYMDVPLVNQHLVPSFSLEWPGLHSTDWGFGVRDVDGPEAGAILAQEVLHRGFGVELEALVEVLENTTTLKGDA